MIEFKPSQSGEGFASFKATNNDETLGACDFIFNSYEMIFSSINCDDDIIKEGLLRGAMNFGANRGAYIATISKNMLCPATNRLGYNENKLSVEIPEALKSTCCSCSN